MRNHETSQRLILGFAISIGAIGLLLGIYSLFAASKTTDNIFLSNRPVHWHPDIEIIIKGEKVAVPADIGIGSKYADNPFYDSMMDMTNMHTHDDSGTLHWEVMMHAPTPQDMYLGNFFQVWEKTFNKNCIFEFCNEPEGSVKMFVNGKSNNDFEKYIVRDGDKIRIVYA